MGSRFTITTGLACLALLLAGGATADAPIVVASGAPATLPEGLDRDRLTAVALASDGAVAVAYAVPDSDPAKAEVALYRTATDAPQKLVVSGIVRDLAFDTSGEMLHVLSFKPPKKTGPGKALLLSVDPIRVRVTNRLWLPATAAGLTVAGELLMIPALNEIRTFRLPDLRSGPLYRIPGRNLSLALVGPGKRALVGQSDSLLLVDLAAGPGRDGLPRLAAVTTAGPVGQLAAPAGASEALARLSDGTLLRVALSPLRVTQAGEARTLVKAPPASISTPAPDTSPTQPEGHDAFHPASAPAPAEQTPVAAPPGLGGGAESAPPGGVASAAELPPGSASPADPPPSPMELEDRPTLPPPPPRTAVELPPRSRTPVPATPKPETEAPSTPFASAPALRGRIVGPAAELVTEIVVFGPNNLLREAARVRPSGGGWHVAELPAGRYRIVVDGGGERVLVTEPRFVLVEVTPDGAHEAETIRVLRAL